LYFAFGPIWAIALNACSFGVSSLLIRLIREPQRQARTDRRAKQLTDRRKATFWHEFRAGLRFFVGNRVLVTLLISGMVFMVGGMDYNSFEFLYGIENLHIPGQLLGIYVACYGMGVVIGLPLITALAKRVTEVEVLWLCLMGSGAVMLVLSRMTSSVPG